MVLELHVWGPAFSLPSIEPECLAAIAYLRLLVPQDEWVLIASCDDTLSPTSTPNSLRNAFIHIQILADLSLTNQEPCLRFVVDQHGSEVFQTLLITLATYRTVNGISMSPIVALVTEQTSQRNTSETR